jgi:hypothetical protein
MTLLLSGLLLVAAGAGLPFLMVIRVLELSLLLAVLAYAASLSGLLLGIVGTVKMYYSTSYDQPAHPVGDQGRRLP